MRHFVPQREQRRDNRTRVIPDQPIYQPPRSTDPPLSRFDDAARSVEPRTAPAPPHELKKSLTLGDTNRRLKEASQADASGSRRAQQLPAAHFDQTSQHRRPPDRSYAAPTHEYRMWRKGDRCKARYWEDNQVSVASGFSDWLVFVSLVCQRNVFGPRSFTKPQ